MVDELEVAEEKVTGVDERNVNVDGRTGRRKAETMARAKK